MIGSFVTGRLVGRVSSEVLVRSGFVISLAGGVYAVGYRLAVAHPTLFAVLVPVAAAALGLSLVFPILTTTCWTCAGESGVPSPRSSRSSARASTPWWRASCRLP